MTTVPVKSAGESLLKGFNSCKCAKPLFTHVVEGSALLNVKLEVNVRQSGGSDGASGWGWATLDSLFLKKLFSLLFKRGPRELKRG